MKSQSTDSRKGNRPVIGRKTQSGVLDFNQLRNQLIVRRRLKTDHGRVPGKETRSASDQLNMC